MITQSKVERHERLLDICKAVIADPHSVDADTVAAFKSAALKLAERYNSDPIAALKQLYVGDSELSDHLRKAAAIVVGKVDDDAEEVEKAVRNRDNVGGKGLGSAIMDHAIDVLDHLRRKHGFEKANTEKEHTMSLIESFQSVAKTHGVPGVVEIAKNMRKEQKNFGLTEEEFCKLIDTAARVTHPELGAHAFEKVFERNPVLAEAISVIKAGEPGRGAYTKADPAPNTDTAYTALMAKARDYQTAHPELSEAQAFDKVYTDRSNIELAKRERIESAPW
jgi:hypothetical protein